MGGLLGIGGSSAKTDRNTQLSAQQGLWSVFNQGIGTGAPATKDALGGLDSAKAYWQKLLTRGRTQTAQDSAPAVNAAQDQADAAKRQEGNMGTGRGGGTAAINREASSTTAKSIDDIINQNMMGGRSEGAKGIASTSTAEGNIGMGLEGLAAGAVSDIMGNATKSRELSYKINQQEGQAVAQLILAGLAL